QLQKRPVAECQQHPDCLSCLLAHDPYCGWCVLDGRCVLQSQCSRGHRSGQWLWSFDMDQQCLLVQELNPLNLSREESQMVSLAVPGLPLLDEPESYSCMFEDIPQSCCSQWGQSPLPVSQSRLVTHGASWPGCRGCVLSRWGCNWCIQQHLCTHSSTCEDGVVIYNQHVSD
ncbi:unnamed protein product, partial [Tetraodon nigroviridis]